MNKEFFTEGKLRLFVDYIVSERRVNFHPDEAFVNYINIHGQKTFGKSEARLFDLIMRGFFEHLHTRVYEICLEEFNRITYDNKSKKSCSI